MRLLGVLLLPPGWDVGPLQASILLCLPNGSLVCSPGLRESKWMELRFLSKETTIQRPGLNHLQPHPSNRKSDRISDMLTTTPPYRGRTSSVGRVLDCRVGGRGFDSRGRTDTQGHKVTEK